MLNIVMLNIIMLNVIMLNAIMLNVIMLNVIMLNVSDQIYNYQKYGLVYTALVRSHFCHIFVVMLSVDGLNVMAPFR